MLGNSFINVVWDTVQEYVRECLFDDIETFLRGRICASVSNDTCQIVHRVFFCILTYAIGIQSEPEY